MLDGNLLYTERNINPYLTDMLLGFHHSEHAHIEGEALLGRLKFDQSTDVAVLIMHHSSWRIRRKVGLGKFEGLNSHCLGIGTKADQHQEGYSEKFQAGHKVHYFEIAKLKNFPDSSTADLREGRAGPDSNRPQDWLLYGDYP
jgi:hypothetical protein